MFILIVNDMLPRQGHWTWITFSSFRRHFDIFLFCWFWHVAIKLQRNPVAETICMPHYCQPVVGAAAQGGAATRPALPHKPAAAPPRPQPNPVIITLIKLGCCPSGQFADQLRTARAVRNYRIHFFKGYIFFCNESFPPQRVVKILFLGKFTFTRLRDTE